MLWNVLQQVHLLSQMATEPICYKDIIDTLLSRSHSNYTRDTDSENGENSSDEEDKEDDELQKTYNNSIADAIPSDTDDPTGPAINQSLAKALDYWFRDIHSGSEIQEVLKAVKYPENATALKQVVVNDEVKKFMSCQDRIKTKEWNGFLMPS